MTYDQFVSKWTGVFADYDGWYGAQCVDLFNFYNRDVVGQTFVGTPDTGGAADLWNDWDALDGYTKVPNSPTAIPPKGAAVIWAANTKVTGAAGHVGIASGEGDTSHFVSFDQNYPTGSLPHMQRHTYDGVLGWYVPTNQGEEMKIPDQDNWFWRFDKLMFAVRGRHISREEFEKNFVGVEAFHMVEIVSDDAEADAATHAQEVGQVAVRDKWDEQISGLQAQVKEIQAQVADLSTQTQSQQATIDQLNQDNEALTGRATAAETRAAALEQDLKALKASQTSPDAPQPAPTPNTPVPSPDVPGGFITALKRLRDWIVSQWNKSK